MRKKDNHIINEEIDIPDELDVRINLRISRLKKSKPIGKNITIVIFSLIMISAVAIRFNPDINAYASKMPVISEIMSWFRSDKSAQYAKEKGYNTYDLNVEKDGYKLYIKDLYLDKRNVDMKFAVEDKDGKYLNNIQWKVTYPQFIFGVDQGDDSHKVDPWQESSITFPNINDFENMKTVKMKITIKKENKKLVSFDNIEVNLKENPMLQVKKYAQDCKENFDIGEIEIEELQVLPGKMYLKYKTISKDGFTRPWIRDPKLVDDKGNIYNSTSHSLIVNSQTGEEEEEFEPSFYFDTPPKKLKLVFADMRALIMKDKFTIDVSKKVSKEIHDQGTDFTIYKVERDKEYFKVYVKSNFRLRNNEFPRLSIKRGEDYWEEGASGEDTTRNYTFTKGEAEKVLEKSIENVLKLQGEEFKEAISGFKKYFEETTENTDKNYGDQYFRDKLCDINNRGYISLGFNKNETSKEIVYYFSNIPESEIYEFCVLGGIYNTQKEEIELNIK